MENNEDPIVAKSRDAKSIVWWQRENH